MLVVGNAGEFEKQLAALGPVTPIDITIPAPEPKAGAARPAGSSTPSAMAKPPEALAGSNAEGKPQK